MTEKYLSIHFLKPEEISTICLDCYKALVITNTLHYCNIECTLKASKSVVVTNHNKTKKVVRNNKHRAPPKTKHVHARGRDVAKSTPHVSYTIHRRTVAMLLT